MDMYGKKPPDQTFLYKKNIFYKNKTLKKNRIK